MRFKILFSLSIALICILGFILIFNFQPPKLEEENLSKLDFCKRWAFYASLEQSSYSSGENIALTVNLMCLVTHNVTNYAPDLLQYLKLFNSSGNLIWHPALAPGRIYIQYEFHKGVNLGGIYIIGLSTENLRLKIDSALPPGSYYFIVNLPLGLLFSEEEDQAITLLFEVT